MKKCSHCGYLNDDGNKFCRKCGQLFPVPVPEPVAMPQKSKGKGCIMAKKFRHPTDAGIIEDHAMRRAPQKWSDQ